MSNEQNIYIGAYLELKMLPYNTEDAVNECPEHGDISKIARNAKFCPTCGAQIVKVYHQKEKFYSYFDITDDDSLMDTYINDGPDDQIVLVSNRDDGTHICLDQSDEGVFDIGNEGRAIDTLCEDNKSLIQYLINHQFVESVKYKFGIIVYWY